MRISDWSSDVCSSDLFQLSRSKAPCIGDVLYIDFVADMLTRSQSGSTTGGFVRSQYPEAIYARSRTQFAQRVQATAAVTQRVQRGGELQGLSSREIRHGAAKQDTRHHFILGQSRIGREADLRIKGTAGHVQDRRDAFDIAATGKIKRRIDLTFAGEANPPFRQFKGTARKTIGAAHQAYIALDTEIGRGPGNAKIAGPFQIGRAHV